MLKTNSKKVKEAIKKYIIDNYDADYFEDVNGNRADTFEEMAKNILTEMKRVEGFEVGRKYASRKYPISWQDAFEIWAETLPCGFDTAPYYYTGRAVDVLGDILEQTETERNKYTESDACHLMSYLIYRELSNVAWQVLR